MKEKGGEDERFVQLLSVLQSYQKVHLLLDDIMVVAAEGGEKCLGVRECIELRSAFQNHTTVISSTEIHALITA